MAAYILALTAMVLSTAVFASPQVIEDALASDDVCLDGEGNDCGLEMRQLLVRRHASGTKADAYLICSAAHPDLCLQLPSSVVGPDAVQTPGSVVTLVNKDQASAFYQGEQSISLVGKYAGGCLDVKDHMAVKGAIVQSWKCLDWNTDQRFTLPALGKPGQIRWKNHPELCLDVKDHQFVPGAPLQMWTCQSFNSDQLWLRKGFDWEP